MWTFEEAQEILEEGYDLLDKLAQDPSDANREQFRRWEARNKEFLRCAR